MRINIFDFWEIEIDWQAIAAIAIALLAYALAK